MAVERLRIRITGRVQGVGFRWYAKTTAEQLAVCGFILNETDGSLYIEAEAEETVLVVLCDSLRKGPPSSLVSTLVTETIEPVHNESSFLILAHR